MAACAVQLSSVLFGNRLWCILLGIMDSLTPWISAVDWKASDDIIQIIGSLHTVRGIGILCCLGEQKKRWYEDMESTGTLTSLYAQLLCIYLQTKTPGARQAH